MAGQGRASRGDATTHVCERASDSVRCLRPFWWERVRHSQCQTRQQQQENNSELLDARDVDVVVDCDCDGDVNRDWVGERSNCSWSAAVGDFACSRAPSGLVCVWMCAWWNLAAATLEILPQLERNCFLSEQFAKVFTHSLKSTAS